MNCRRKKGAWRGAVKRAGALLLCAVMLSATAAGALDLDKLGYPEEQQGWVKSAVETSLAVTPDTARFYLEAIAQRKQEIKDLGGIGDRTIAEDIHFFTALVDIDENGSAELIICDSAPDWNGSGSPSNKVSIYSGQEKILSYGQDYRDSYFSISPPYIIEAYGFPASSGTPQDSYATLYRLEAGQLVEVTTRFLNYGSLYTALLIGDNTDEDGHNYFEEEVTIRYTDETGKVHSITDRACDFGGYNSLPYYREDSAMEMVNQIKAEMEQKGIDLDSPVIEEVAYGWLQYPHGSGSWDGGTEQILQSILDAEARGEKLLAPTDTDFKQIAETVSVWDSIFDLGSADLTQGEYPPANTFFTWFHDEGKVAASSQDREGLNKFIEALKPEYAPLAREQADYLSIYETDQTAMDLVLEGLYGNGVSADRFFDGQLKQGRENYRFPVQSKDGKWYCAYPELGMGGHGYNTNLNATVDLGDDFYTAYLSKIYLDEGYTTYGGTYTMLLRRAPEGSAVPFQILKITEGNLDITTVNAIKNQVLSSNTQYDYQQVSGFTTAQAYIEYLEGRLKDLNGTPINDKGKLETAQYIQFLYENATVPTLSTKKNHLILNAESLKTATEGQTALQGQVNTLLKQYQVALNKDLQVTLKVLASGLDTGKDVTVELDRSTLEALKGAHSLRVLFDGKGTGFHISVADLTQALSANESLRFTLGQKEGVYKLTFLDSEGKAQTNAAAPITLYLPADTPYASVEVEYGEYLENWGGQYDGKNALIFFSTSLSGLYTVMESEVPILDIDALAEEQQGMIRFLVSRGIFAAEDGAFAPDALLSRYDFTEALVKMFYALDREAACTFTDVPADSSYYPYIASAEQTGIATGVGHGLFAGDQMVTRESVLTFCARTLVDKKGYQYPEDMSRYANFTDRDAIAPWALESVALTEQLGLISGGGVLVPQGELTRAESAELLYRLYMLLYEVAPTETGVDAPAVSPQGSVLPSALCFGIAACVAAAGAALLIPRRMREQLGARGKKLLIVGGTVIVIGGVVSGVLLLPSSGSASAPVEKLPPSVSAQPSPSAPAPTGKPAKAETFIFPTSDQILLTDTDVAGLSQKELMLGRNELFARRGRMFSDPELSAYFTSQSWYRGEIAPDQFDEGVFTEIERGNIAFLQAAQKKAEFTENAHLLTEKIERIQANYFIPTGGKNAAPLSAQDAKSLLDSGKTPLLCLRLVDLDQDGISALLLAYLTKVEDLGAGSGYRINARWELWTLDKNQLVCAAKEDVFSDGIGGGQSHALLLHTAADGLEDKLVSVHRNPQSVEATTYTFATETSTDQYYFEENEGGDIVVSTLNGAALSDANTQISQCKALQAESALLFEMVYDSRIAIYNDLQSSIDAVLGTLEQYQ